MDLRMFHIHFAHLFPVLLSYGFLPVCVCVSVCVCVCVCVLPCKTSLLTGNMIGFFIISFIFHNLFEVFTLGVESGSEPKWVSFQTWCVLHHGSEVSGDV